MPKKAYGTFQDSSWCEVGFASAKTPNYRDLVRKKLPLPINDHTYWWNEGRDPYVLTYNGYKHNDNSGPRLSFSSIQTQFTTEMNNLQVAVSNRLSEKLHTIDVDVGTMLGELPETVRMLTTIMGTLGKAAIAARRGRPKDVVRHLFGTNASKRWRDVPKDSSSVWLGYSYGVKPLITDAYNIIQACEKGLTVPRKTKVSTGLSAPINKNWYNTYIPNNGFKRQSVVGNVGVSGCVFYQVKSPTIVSLQSLGLTNPASIAWELTPLSFVVDWFIPVGAFIQNVVPPVGIDFRGGWIYVKASGSAFNQTSWFHPPNPKPGWFTRCESNWAYKSRTRLASFPRYTLSFDSVQYDLSRNQMASGLALLIQRVIR